MTLKDLHHDNSAKDLVCFSHLRWDFVYQRPQHLMGRFGKQRRVFFIEEPIFHDGVPSWLFSSVEEGVVRCVPKLPEKADRQKDNELIRQLMEDFAERWDCHECIQWFYTPMMLGWADGLNAAAVVYDCMDELSKFRFAPPELVELERQLFRKADLVFTGGHSLYEAKREQHRSVHEFPSSIEASHFRQALFDHDETAEQAELPRPRIGFAGVIDERIDLDLIAGAADLRPDWNFIMIGPVVKIEHESLPQRPNIHYLGMKNYRELPRYFAGWDVGMMPFALNESTRFISPTKTPEYLAAGLPVVSTAITDVVRPYGEMGLVEIASDAAEFIAAAERALAQDKVERLRLVDLFLAERSWDHTARQMNRLINRAANGALKSPVVRDRESVRGVSVAA
ncbi:MAG: glycosyltransferase family 1 protein [bacterium]|nr:glycosyltransferase family 1 protein [bacterium]